MPKIADTNGSSRGLYLRWEGKKIYRQIVPTPRLLEPAEKPSHGSDRPNMLVLASLKPRYAGQVGVIYIDPPYNLGKDDFRWVGKGHALGERVLGAAPMPRDGYTGGVSIWRLVNIKPPSRASPPGGYSLIGSIAGANEAGRA